MAALGSAAFDTEKFRYILGHYPTGVVVVTALDGNEQPVGMVVGSFTSASLDPPLVAFLPDKKSSTYGKMRDAPSFVVNVLSSGQQSVSQKFSSRNPADKWSGVRWRAAHSGAPILDEAVAWIECDFEARYDSGDHYIILGRVRKLEIENPSLPLLFFQGSYGRFTPLSAAAPSETDLVDQIRIADIAREEMERVARDLDVECIAQAVVKRELMHIASAGQPRGTTAPTRVGTRMPHIPPFGGLHVAWADDVAINSWLDRLSPPAGPEARSRHLERLERVRRRGWTMGLVDSSHPVVEATISEFSEGTFTPEFERRVRRLMQGLSDRYEPETLEPDVQYDVRFIGAPVFGPTGRVELAVKLFSLPPAVGLEQIDVWQQRVSAAGRLITEKAGGRFPDSFTAGRG